MQPQSASGRLDGGRRGSRDPNGKPARRRAVAAVQVAVMLVVLVGVAALTIDGGHLMFVRGELQNAADAAALAGA